MTNSQVSVALFEKAVLENFNEHLYSMTNYSLQAVLHDPSSWRELEHAIEKALESVFSTYIGVWYRKVLQFKVSIDETQVSIHGKVAFEKVGVHFTPRRRFTMSLTLPRQDDILLPSILSEIGNMIKAKMLRIGYRVYF